MENEFERYIKSMKKTLEEHPECEYAKNFIRHIRLSDGRLVKVQLLIEIEHDDPMN